MNSALPVGGVGRLQDACATKEGRLIGGNRDRSFAGKNGKKDWKWPENCMQLIDGNEIMR
ncbi:MAG: hypothetical protein C4520_00605 [Candidatus Abyssobacteria bacterium SURF_5]|uniref:Uncharacterized protein n=1 Tax=Abyssobacteria bacterium (strain SURF_5) TaxID=2093360 RepID=A0A3A4PER7_ABYX5|nr:MAG: hypothetical protein C4520_00605 [Candidatus Abyssubacteria bacterium SURF_5]